MIDYDVVETPIGPCSVAVRDGRICRLRLGRGIDVPARRARLTEARRWLRAYFEGRPTRVRLDLSFATGFLRRVYEVVRRIPPGRTRSYGEVARAAGRPGAARAVGSAMARNKICLFIP